MTELSPVAQEVLNATGRKPWYRNDDIAAALRAAADQLKYKILNVEVVDCSQLRLLADELEAV